MSISQANSSSSFLNIFAIFLRLGLTAFGGPIAHLSYFRDEFVIKRQWMSEQNFAEIVSLCQFLPGPTSSQVGMMLGYSQRSYWGALAAWLGFTLPSALMLIALAQWLHSDVFWISPAVTHGLKIVAVAVIAQAVWAMAKNLCPDRARITLMTLVCGLLLMFSSTAWIQITVLLLSGLWGLFFYASNATAPHETLPLKVNRSTGMVCLSLFFILLLGLPILQQWHPHQLLALFNVFYRAGALVFGGGHVVLPLLQSELVPTGWMNNEIFLAGYGATQAMPGPLFTFAAFLGASLPNTINSWLTGFICLLAIFTPSVLLTIGVLPLWQTVRQNPRIQSSLMGVNAAVVGILLCALYQPVWAQSILQSTDFALGLMGFIALVYWRISPWIVVIATSFLSWCIYT